MCTTSSPVLVFKKSRGTRRPWYWLFEKDTPVPRRFPFNKNFGLKIRKFHVPNGTVHSGFTDPFQATGCLLFVPAASRIQRAVLGTTILSNGRDFSVGPTEMSGLVKVNHLQRWSQIFRSGGTGMVHSI